MEIVNCCQGLAWRARLYVARDDLKAEASRLWSDATDISAVWKTGPSGGWHLECPREFATDADPLVDVAVERSGARTIVRATLGNRVTTVVNATAISPDGRVVAMR
jgi:hypothetical protein